MNTAILFALIEAPSTIAPMSPSTRPSRMPGFRPNLSVICPIGYATINRDSAISATDSPARLAEFVSAITMSGPIP